jgi:hypothetical protein
MIAAIQTTSAIELLRPDTIDALASATVKIIDALSKPESLMMIALILALLVVVRDTLKQ